MDRNPKDRQEGKHCQGAFVEKQWQEAETILLSYPNDFSPANPDPL